MSSFVSESVAAKAVVCRFTLPDSMEVWLLLKCCCRQQYLQLLPNPLLTVDSETEGDVSESQPANEACLTGMSDKLLSKLSSCGSVAAYAT